MLELAILDDYQHSALEAADWSGVRALANITVFDKSLGPVDQAATALAPFDIVCTMRERTAFPAALIDRLPKLKLITLTGGNVTNLDRAAATANGITIMHTGGTKFAVPGSGNATAELAWGLLLAVVRHIAAEDAEMRRGTWQTTIGTTLANKTLGVVGLGRLGSKVATYGNAFGMNVIAWSQNLTVEKAAAGGARLVSKEELFRQSDAISIHVVLSDRSRGLVGPAEFAQMKRGAVLINTSRGPIIDEKSLLTALNSGAISAGLDTYDIEPLPADHPLRRAPNTVLTPHLGYVAREGYRGYYGDTVENIIAWCNGAPERIVNTEMTVPPRR